MSSKVEWFTPAGTMAPVGPYSHIAKVGQFITIGATAGVDPATGDVVGPDVASQTRQILEAFEIMLATVGSSLDHVIHLNVFLSALPDFHRLNHAYVDTTRKRACPGSVRQVA